MTLSCTSVTWRGLTFSSTHGAPYAIRNVAGWDELPDSRFQSTPRPNAHGSFSDPVFAGERIITLTGHILSPDRDALLHELSAALTWGVHGGRVEDLTITRAGRTLTADARLTAFRTPTDLDFAVGYVPFAVEWRCPDPLRYGQIYGVSTGFPELVGGLRYDLYTNGSGVTTGWLDYGPAPTSGRLLLENEGTAASWPQFEVEGPVGSGGFEVVHVGSGSRLVYEGAVPAGSRLLIDTRTGSVVIDGDSDRTLTRSEFVPVPAGGSAEFAFIPLGSFSAATLRASVRPAFW